MIIDMINLWFQFLLSSCLGVPSISHMCWQPSWVAHRRCHSGRYIRRPCSTLESGNTRWKNKFLNNILLDESDTFSNVDWWRLLNTITIQPASQIHVFAILCWLNLTRIIITNGCDWIRLKCEFVLTDAKYLLYMRSRSWGLGSLHNCTDHARCVYPYSHGVNYNRDSPMQLLYDYQFNVCAAHTPLVTYWP